ncbi:MAG: rhodanese-like domain-containing protein [Burkholderiales bacterium]|nr:rhodanese-like domain-containing protein [Burkholderiales bacterium]
MRRLLLACFLLLAALAARAEVVDIDSAELAKLTAAGVTLIDIRTRPEWEETGIVPGSHLLTFFDERGKADPAAWLNRAKAIAKPGEPVVVICRSGNRTKPVSQFMSQQAGYAKVYNVRNGIRAWAKEGRPMVSAAPTLAACRANKTC